MTRIATGSPRWAALTLVGVRDHPPASRRLLAAAVGHRRRGRCSGGGPLHRPGLQTGHDRGGNAGERYGAALRLRPEMMSDLSRDESADHRRCPRRRPVCGGSALVRRSSL